MAPVYVTRTTPIGLADRSAIDKQFLEDIIAELSETNVQTGQSEFLTEMHNGFQGTRSTLRGLLDGTRFGGLVTAIAGYSHAGGDTAGGIGMAILGAAIIIGSTVGKRLLKKNFVEFENYGTKKHKKNEGDVRQRKYEQEMEVFIQTKKQLTQARGQLGTGATIDFDPILTNVRNTFGFAKQKTQDLEKLAWMPMWPTITSLPSWAGNKIKDNKERLEEVNKYIDDYESQKFPQGRYMGPGGKP